MVKQFIEELENLQAIERELKEIRHVHVSMPLVTMKTGVLCDSNIVAVFSYTLREITEELDKTQRQIEEKKEKIEEILKPLGLMLSHDDYNYIIETL